MFYEEINEGGLWYYRTSPNGDWHEFDKWRYAAKIASLRLEIQELRTTLGI